MTAAPPLFGCIEAGGTKFVLGVARDPDTVLRTARIPTTTPDETLAAALEFFTAAQAEWGAFDALGIASAHICGASMGGMIAQRMAAIAPGRVRSLILMMTSSGARRLPGPTLKVRSAMISRPSSQTVEGIVEHYVRLYALIGSPAYPSPPAWLSLCPVPGRSPHRSRPRASCSRPSRSRIALRSERPSIART